MPSLLHHAHVPPPSNIAVCPFVGLLHKHSLTRARRFSRLFDECKCVCTLQVCLHSSGCTNKRARAVACTVHAQLDGRLLLLRMPVLSAVLLGKSLNVATSQTVFVKLVCDSAIGCITSLSCALLFAPEASCCVQE